MFTSAQKRPVFQLHFDVLNKIPCGTGILYMYCIFYFNYAQMAIS